MPIGSTKTPLTESIDTHLDTISAARHQASGDADAYVSDRSASSSRSSFSSDSSWDAELEPTSSLLQKPDRKKSRNYRSSDTVRLKMLRTPTLRRSHSSKRIFHRDSDSEDDNADGQQQPGSPVSRRRSRIASSASRHSFRRSMSRHEGLESAAPASEPTWLAGFDERRSAKENKSLAISAELDAMGMGKYQVSTLRSIGKTENVWHCLLTSLFTLMA